MGQIPKEPHRTRTPGSAPPTCDAMVYDEVVLRKSKK